jgi:hypothetical protein
MDVGFGYQISCLKISDLFLMKVLVKLLEKGNKLNGFVLLAILPKIYDVVQKKILNSCSTKKEFE